MTDTDDKLPKVGSAADLVSHLVGTPHPSIIEKIRLFAYAHLPPHLQTVSVDFARLAVKTANGPRNSETTISLDRLREAKDRAITAHVLDNG